MSSIGEYAADALERMAGYYDARYPDPDDALTYIHGPERLVLETGTPGVVAHTHICAADERIAALQEQIDALRQAVAQQGADTPLRTMPAKAAMRLAELEAKWAAVPWDALRSFAQYGDTYSYDYRQFRKWFDANAPQEVSE